MSSIGFVYCIVVIKSRWSYNGTQYNLILKGITQFNLTFRSIILLKFILCTHCFYFRPNLPLRKLFPLRANPNPILKFNSTTTFNLIMCYLGFYIRPTLTMLPLVQSKGEINNLLKKIYASWGSVSKFDIVTN